MIDLGAWATEAYRVPAVDYMDTPQSPPGIIGNLFGERGP
jgi:endogenous inhibitor of DNA gyrase (YacG/DUF329 family)